jgi:hypothetical protein
MEYMLMLYFNEQGWPTLTLAEQQAGLAMHEAYRTQLEDAGVLRAANSLRPSHNAKTVRVAEGKTRILDGPFAESKEQIGGFYVIDVPDLDTAISWAARCPASKYGAVEVRPLGLPPQKS